MTRTSGGRLKILDIERSLGVWWPLGFSRHKDRLKIPIVKRLEDGVKKITPVFGAKNQTEIRASEELRVEAERLFADVAPELWPDADQDRSGWLTDATQNDLGGKYTQNLYYSNDEDRARLWDRFYLLIIAKTIRYYENHGRGWHYEPEPEAMEARANGLLDHFSDGSDDSDYETETPAEEIKRPRSDQKRKSHYSPSGFTPVNGTALPPFVDHDGVRTGPNGEPQAASTGEPRTLISATAGDPDVPLAPIPQGSKKRKGIEEAELPATKRAKQQPTARTSSGPTANTTVGSTNVLKLKLKRPVQSNDTGISVHAASHSTPSQSMAAENRGSLGLPTPNGNQSSSDPSPSRSSLYGSTVGQQSSRTTDMTSASSTSTNGVAAAILGTFATGPVATQLLSTNDRSMSTSDWMRVRAVFERVPATQTDSHALVTELSKSTMTSPTDSLHETQQDHQLAQKVDHDSQAELHSKAEEQNDLAEPTDGGETAGGSNVQSRLLQFQRLRDGYMRDGYIDSPEHIPAPYRDVAGSTRDTDDLRAHARGHISNTASPSAVTMNGLSAPSSGPVRDASTTAKPELDARTDTKMIAPRSSNDDIFARTEVEIDWCADGQVQGFMQLEAGDDVNAFFENLDDELPPSLQGRATRAVRVEHLNPTVDTGKAFNARIRRGGSAAFKALVKRLQQQGVGAVPELVVTVEWEA